jgi:hypothetical protein
MHKDEKTSEKSDIGYGGDRPGVWVEPKAKKKAAVNYKDPQVFFDYCWKFYAPGEIYGEYFGNKLKPEDLKEAIAERMKDPKFEGDSVDREAVRDMLLTDSKYKKYTSKKKADTSERPKDPAAWVIPDEEMDETKVEREDIEEELDMIDADDMLPLEPDADDIVITTEGQLGSEYAAYQSGKEIARSADWEELEDQIRKHMKATNWYPEVWFQDDHGGLERTTIASKKKVSRRIIAGFVSVMNRKWEFVPQYDLAEGRIPLTGYEYFDDTGQRILAIKTSTPFTEEQHKMTIYKEYLEKVMASKRKKNEKVGMNFKHLYKLATECPDCFKKFLKFASEKGTTLVVDQVETTVEQLKQKIEETKKRLASEASKKKAGPVFCAEPGCNRQGQYLNSPDGRPYCSKHMPEKDVEKEAQTPLGPPPQEDPGQDMEWWWDGKAWVKKQKGNGGAGAAGISPHM